MDNHSPPPEEILYREIIVSEEMKQCYRCGAFHQACYNCDGTSVMLQMRLAYGPYQPTRVMTAFDAYTGGLGQWDDEQAQAAGEEDHGGYDEEEYYDNYEEVEGEQDYYQSHQDDEPDEAYAREEEINEAEACELVATISNGDNPENPRLRHNYFLEQCPTPEDEASLLGVYNALFSLFNVSPEKIKQWMQAGRIRRQALDRFSNGRDVVDREL